MNNTPINNISDHKFALLKKNYVSDEKLITLAKKLRCPIIPWQPLETITSVNYILTFNEQNILCLHKAGQKKQKAVFVDFSSGPVDHRRKFGGGKGQAIAKAVGLQDTTHSLKILDCTAGLGRDAFVLATLGCDITLLERSPVVYTLLEDGLQRASHDPKIADIIQRMHAHAISAHSHLQDMAMGESSSPSNYDVIYLDPMFPHKKKVPL